MYLRERMVLGFAALYPTYGLGAETQDFYGSSTAFAVHSLAGSLSQSLSAPLITHYPFG